MGKEGRPTDLGPWLVRQRLDERLEEGRERNSKPETAAFRGIKVRARLNSWVRTMAAKTNRSASRMMSNLFSGSSSVALFEGTTIKSVATTDFNTHRNSQQLGRIGTPLEALPFQLATWSDESLVPFDVACQVIGD
jgi:hypothetical protein